MRKYDHDMKRTYRYIVMLIAVFLLFLCGVFGLLYGMEAKKHRWVQLQRENLEYVFDESASCRLLKLSEAEKLYQEVYETAYDFDGDEAAEPVQVAFARQSEQNVVTVTVGGTEPVQVALDCPDGYRMSCVITGIDGKEGKLLGIVESVFAPEDGKGYLNCHLFSVRDNAFVKSADYTYSGVIGGPGHMVEGTVENAMPENAYAYDVKTNQNGYIYERSVILADMKDVGLMFPYETVGKFQMRYKRNVTGLFYVIVY